MDRIEQLVALSYTPGIDKPTLEQAQRELQSAQKSSEGWNSAGAMLNSQNANTQFLGAQTFLVKLNQGTNIPPPNEQRSQLLGWLRQAVASNTPRFIVIKSLSVVTKSFLNSDDWKSCVTDVLQVVGSGSVFSFAFLEMLIEDSELPANDLRAKLVPDVSQTVISMLQSVGLANEPAIRMLEVWATTFFDVFKPMMSDLILLVTQTYFVEEAEDVCVAAMKCLENSYSFSFRSWSSLDRRDLGKALESIAGTYSVVPPPEFSDDTKFSALAKLILSYCAEDFTQTGSHAFIAQSASTKTSVVDDPLAVEVIGFWNQFTEEVISSGLSSDSTPVIASVISNYWPRIKIYDGLRPSEWEEFSSFRKDFADFIELAYPLMGNELFEYSTTVVLDSLPNLDWFTIESGMYCSNGLSDIIGDDYRGEIPESRSVQRIFQSDSWSKSPECSNFRVKQTAVNLIGCFVDFFASPEGHAYLAVTSNYLFTCLGDQPSQNTASRSIQKSCETCRGSLTGEIGAFIAVYGQIRERLLTVPHIRTVSGIAYVIQAQIDLVRKADALDKLSDLILTAESIDLTPEENRQNQLKCVAAVGKGVKELDNIDNPASAVPQDRLSTATVAEFWQSNALALNIRQKIQSIIGSSLGETDLTTIEAICDIVKAGMTEDSGPFVLDESMVIQFIVSKFQAGPPAVLSPVSDLAKFYIMTCRASLKSKKTDRLSPQYIKELMRMSDQDIVVDSLSAALDLSTQLVLSASSADVTLSDLGPIGAIRHAYVGSTISDRFVLKSAVTFWKEFLTFNPSSADQAEPLVRIVSEQLSTQATRSESGSIIDVSKHSLSKHTLVAAPVLKEMVITHPVSINIEKLDAKVRRDFVAQLSSLRGGRKSFEVAQKFWLQCRNIPENYNPVINSDV